MSDTKLPVGIQLTPLDETYRENPYKVLNNIRNQTRVHHDSEMGSYLYTNHDDVRQILRDKAMWTDPRKANPGTFNYVFLGGDSDQEPSMLMMDEPGHRRLRSLVSKPFTPAAVEKWRPRTKAVVQRILEKISLSAETDDHCEFDFIKDFAGPIPTVVIAEMLAIDPAKHADFKSWSDILVKVAFNAFPTEEESAAAEIASNSLNAFFAAEITQRRKDLGDDLLSDMLGSEEEGERLSDDEVIQQCNLLLIAGNVTTTDLIGNSIKALIDHPAEMEKLRRNPELIKNAVEELLRYDSPVINSGRIANREVNLGGCPVAKGECLSTSLAAANHDPEIYDKPHLLDIERKDTHHQSFGGGRHMCLGAHLARIEAQEAILALLAKFPSLALSEKGYQYASIPGFRGFSELWIKAS